MRRNFWIILGAIVVLIVLAGLVDWPTGPNIQIGKYYKELKVHEGLDLQGGTHLVYELDTTGLKQEDINSALQSVSDIMDRRVNSLGVAEATVQSAKIGGKDAVLIELPGVMDISEALRRIGKTAHLQFLEQDEKGELKATELTGANLKKSDVTFESQSNEPQVSLEFNEEGTKLLEEITKRNLQKPLAPELDGEIISMPIVQSVISSGKAVITGQFTVKDATELATLLNAGALPVPIKVAQQYSIGPTLGREAVQKSLIAGLIGIALVALFMIVLYRLPGVIATLALIIYTLIVLAIFKLIPVTLTLSGIAGFILSIGMAVDANILIFERTKEELRLGKTGGLAIDEGFKRAWTSIRDSNISSLITCLILYFCTTGLVRGFAITLAIGIVVSMFTAISVTKTFLTLTTMFKGKNE